MQLPLVESVAELKQLTDPPLLTMEIADDDDPNATPTITEQLEAIFFLEARDLIPKALGDELRSVIAAGECL